MKRVRVDWNLIPRTIEYEVQYRKVGSNTWTNSVFVQVNYIILMLEIGMSYQFRVKSVCHDEVSDWGYLGINVFTNSGSCNPPSNVVVEHNDISDFYEITWDRSNNTQSWIFRYRIQNTLAWTTVPVTTPSIMLSSLVVGATYEYQVQTICTAGIVSNWGNIGYFDTVSRTSNQLCPILLDEDWQISAPVIGRKDAGNTVVLSGTMTLLTDFPAEGDFVVAGTVGTCCSPLRDITVPVDNNSFVGELTINASGQIIIYVAKYKSDPSLYIALNWIMYMSFENTCPDLIPPAPVPTAVIEFNLPAGNMTEGKMTMNIRFGSTISNGITFKWGFCVINNAVPGFNYCYGFPGASHDSTGSQFTAAVIGAGASTYTQLSNSTVPGSTFGYITKIYIYDLVGIAASNIQSNVGQNYELIFL